MSNFTLREYRNEDIPALKKLWHEVFGDPESLVEKFLALLGQVGSGHLAEVNGELAGAAYLLRGLDYVDGDELIPCGYIYAVASYEKFRGMGIGSALTKACAVSAEQWHAKMLCTLPAEDSLYKWYEELVGVKPVLYRKRSEISCTGAAECRKLSATEYLLERETRLAGKCRLSVSWHIMEFQRLLCEEYGGGLYMGEDFIGFGYVDGGAAQIKELICDEEKRIEAASAMAAAMGAEKAVLYEASEYGEPYIAADRDGLCSTCIWNVSFD